MSYLDGLALGLLHYHDADFRRDTWFTYHNLYMCRLEACPICFNPQLPNPQIFPARSIAEASAQFQVRDPTLEREGPINPIYGPFDCWQNQPTVYGSKASMIVPLLAPRYLVGLANIPRGPRGLPIAFVIVLQVSFPAWPGGR
eukprot:scaffold5610_cov137-Isochrysis_galbana.AAC.6